MAKWCVGEQGSELWLKERLGCLTGSMMETALDFTAKGKSSAARRKYLIETAIDRAKDRVTDHFVTSWMQRGTDLEPLARESYQLITGNLVQQVGFALHDTIEFFGCSVDGLVGSEGTVEIKVPTPVNHAEIVFAGVVPDQYKKQMATGLLITGRKWCDFISFDPDAPEPSRTFIRRYVPTEEELTLIERGAKAFLAEVEEYFNRYTRGE